MSDIFTAPFVPSLPITHIVDGVYISGNRATMFASEMRQEDVKNVLKLYGNSPGFPGDFNTLELAIDDGVFIPPATLDRGVDFVEKYVRLRQRVLVMCGAGISRSSTFILGYLVRQNFDLRDAFLLLREHHPAAQPHPEMWRSLISHYRLKYSVKEAMGWV